MMQSIKLKGKNGMFTPASFSHQYVLKTSQQSNDKGSWFGWEVTKLGPVENADLYHQAKSFAESISKGDVQVKWLYMLQSIAIFIGLPINPD